jgi:tRNA-Thr(GGU) m(6)t(6)A37 methyltransferase TsaA
MEKEIQLSSVGTVINENGMFVIELKPEYRQALTNIDGFSHLQIVWWGDLSDNPEQRVRTTVEKPYTKGPDVLGLFATRSEYRPNPVLITNIEVAQIDYERGRISTYYIDAEPGTPVIDIKPYHKSERIRDCKVPAWCDHWPQWYEDSGDFNWQDEFNF